MLKTREQMVGEIGGHRVFLVSPVQREDWCESGLNHSAVGPPRAEGHWRIDDAGKRAGLANQS